MSKIDELYAQAQAAYEARKDRGLRVVGFRDDLETVQEWYSYIMQHRPITYAAYLQLRLDQMNGDVPEFKPIWRYELPK